MAHERHLIHDDAGRQEEARSAHSIEEQQDSGCQQNRECQKGKDRGDEQRPLGQRQPHHGHASGPHGENGRDVVQTAHQTRRREQGDGRNPQRHPGCLAGRGIRKCAQRSVSRPASHRGAARHEQCRENHDAGEQEHPVRERIQKRKRHVPRSDLQRNQKISKAARQDRREQKEHHDGAVHGDERNVKARLHDAAVVSHRKDLRHQWRQRSRPCELVAHEHRQKATHDGHRHRGNQVLNADDFVVRAEHIFPPKAQLRMMVFDGVCVVHDYLPFQVAGWLLLG